MAYSSHFLVYVIWSFVTPAYSWDVLTDALFRRDETSYIFNNEFRLGDCNNKKNTVRLLTYNRQYWVNRLAVGNAIIREEVKTDTLPRCVYVRASTYEEDRYRVSRYSFDLCMARVTIINYGKRYLAYYTEIIIPQDFHTKNDGGYVYWSMFFYGRKDPDWIDA